MTSQLRKINNVIEQFLLPLAEAVSGWSTLAAIRSALIVTLPLMFLGSLAELLISFPLDAYREFMFRQFGPEWKMFGQILKDATFSVMSLIMVFSIGHHLTDQFNHDNPVLRANPVIAGLVAFTAFFCLLQQDGDALNRRWLGVAGLFVAILVGVFATRLFLYFFSIKRLHLHLPGGTPDIAIPQAFNAFIPGMLTVLVFAALGAAMLANEVAAAAGEPLPHIMTKTFMDTFVFMGGAGTGISLAGALILFGKTQASRKIGIFSLVPGLFNINEVLLFGLPIVLNPLMLIPFLLTPVLLAAISYVAVAAGLVPGTNVATEWTTPILLNGYLSTGSLSGSALQLANLVVGVLIYAPFVLIANKIKVKQINDAFRSLLRRSCATADSSRRCLDHNDDAGSLARSLITDLEYDYRHGEGLFLEFQPQICSRTGRVVGVESLIRWKHPSYGLIPAPITVALAEDSGLIRPIGLWVFETACQVRKSWLDAGITDLWMAVNVSALQLESSFPKQLLDIAARYDLPPSLLEVEVTESSALDSDKPESHILSRVYDAGFPVAIDDFGMGHSSLKYLKQFPVSVVKIDGAISREVGTNSICSDIVASITRLCRARNMLSVAEFVENEEQAALLRELGCDVFQGYLYSKSLLPSDCLQFIQKTNGGNGA